MKSILLSFCLLFCTVLSATTTPFVSAGAEACRMKRMRYGGTQQQGTLNGARLTYNRLAPSCIYLGADYFKGKAQMSGHSGTQKPIASEITDSILEGRFGYVFPTQAERVSLFALFTGYGSFRETNDFNHPTPLPLTFTDTFSYIPVGFLAGINVTSFMNVGLNFKAMFMLDGESHIFDEELNSSETLLMNNEINIRIELPVTLSPSDTLFNLSFAVVPFLELRHFGGREGYPYDFLDTKFNLIGGRLALVSYF
ncbi:MAG: hypothetical protein JSS62_05620 [Verrucomicrobia bacterium]|nr:hypothetical protein [Verrucomicrobiota bacterium]MBS0647173.1 hypothetical protein [Verrucomicrobiota bacterium]